MIDPVIFGDNQFFGVNHMSEEKGMEQARRFQDDAAVVGLIDAVYAAGVHAFSFSTHDRVAGLCDHFRAHPERYADLRLYPAMPYAHKYAHAVAEKGMARTVADAVFAGQGAKGVASMLMRGGALVLNQDPVEVMKLLIDVEMKAFRGLRVEAVFLQNIVTDLLLGLGWKEMFVAFARFIADKYGARAGFITLNLPRLVSALEECGVEEPLVCAAINKAGFQVHPDVASYESTLARGGFDAVAMSVFAGGALRPTEALEYVTQQQSVRALLFGASTIENVQRTLDAMAKCGWAVDGNRR